MLNCSKANKIECRLDLFGAWFWEYSHVADLSLCLHPPHPLFAQGPISSNAWLRLDILLDYFISPPVTSSKVMTSFSTVHCCWSQIAASRTGPSLSIRYHIMEWSLLSVGYPNTDFDTIIWVSRMARVSHIFSGTFSAFLSAKHRQ